MLRAGVAEDEEPEVSVAILADGLVVRCASLGPTVAAPSRRRTEFCPNTVDVFAWPMDQYDLTTRCAKHPGLLSRGTGGTPRPGSISLNPYPHGIHMSMDREISL